MTRLRSHNQTVSFRTGRVSRPAPELRVGAVRAPGHKGSLLTLLSAGDAVTADLAACLELSAPYVRTLLDELELEGRIESRKVGKTKVWAMP